MISPTRRRSIAGAIIIFIAVLVVYLPAIQAGFVWDDNSFLTANPLMKASDGIARFWFSTEPPDYFPLTSSMLWFEWQHWGMNAMGYHVVNCLIHVGCSLLLWRILKRLAIPGAWLAAIIFALHPVNVETVAWVTQRKTLLPMLFACLAVLLYLRFEDEGKRRWYVTSIFSFALALLSKTSVVMLPFALIGCAWWRRGTIVKKDIVRSIPYFALSFVLSLVTIWFQYNRSIGTEIVRTDPFFSRLAGAGWAVWFYLYKAIVPTDLMFVYPRWNIDSSVWQNYVPGALFVVLLLALWHYRAALGRAPLFALGYFSLSLFPMLGFFNIYYFRYSFVADHYQYQSIIAVIALIVGCAVTMYQRVDTLLLRRVFVGIALIVVCLLGGQTFRQSGVYENFETLFVDTHQKNPSSWMPLYNLGHYKQQQGMVEEAIDYYTKGIVANPANPDPHNNLANLYLEQKKYPLAIDHYRAALAIEPDFDTPHYNLGIALYETKQFRSAAEHFQQALRANPRLIVAYNNLANTYVALGRPHQALPYYYQALRLNSQFGEAKKNLIIVLNQLANH